MSDIRGVLNLGDCTHALAGQTVDLPPFPRRDNDCSG